VCTELQESRGFVDGLLDALVEEGLAYRDSRRALSLAVRARGQPA
jgi:hypothetical protein